MVQEQQTPRLIPIPKWNEYHADPTPSALRWLVFTNKDDFCKRCVVKRGNRLLINEQAYFAWLLEHNANGEWTGTGGRPA